MDHETKMAVINRLKSITGHVGGITAMVEEDRYCIDVIKQIQAAQAALVKVSQMILDNHLHTCLITAIRGENPDERERALTDISDVFAQRNR